MKAVTLVLLPGLDGSGKLFAPFVRALPDHIKPVVVSYPVDRALDYAGHLEYVMAALPADEPFVLLGESFSGPLALLAAAQNPAGLRGIILCATFATWPLTVPVSVARLFVSLGIFQLKSTPMIQRLLLGKNVTAELKELFLAALDRVRPEVLAARAQAVINFDCSKELSQCPAPILALVAERDRIVSRNCAEHIRRIRPDTTFVRINSPHLILQCATNEAVQVITGFLDTLYDRKDRR